MPSVEQGEKKDHYMKRCVPMLIKEGKKQDQAVAQCLNMFKEKWKAKAKEDGKPTDSPEWKQAEEQKMQAAMANFNWDECAECLEREREANHKMGFFELDIPNKTF